MNRTKVWEKNNWLLSCSLRNQFVATCFLLLFSASTFAAKSVTGMSVGAQTGSVTTGTAGSVSYTVTGTYSGSGSASCGPLKVDGLPSSVSYTRPTLSTTGGNTTSTAILTLMTSATTSSGDLPFTVSCDDDGKPSVNHTAVSTLTVNALAVAEYRFDDVAWCTPASALDTVGGHNGTLIGSVTTQDSPVSGGKPVNGSAAGFSSSAIDITGLPLNLANGAVNSVSFWMYWDGTDNVMPMGFGSHDLWLRGGSFGFNTFNSDVFGIASTGLVNGWHHVAAVFTNGNVTANKLWIDGVQQTLTQRASSPNNANAVASTHLRLSGVWGNTGYLFSGKLDVVRIYSGLMTQAQVNADRVLTSSAVVCPPPPPPVPATLVAHYQLNDNWDVTHAAVNSVAGAPAGTFSTPYVTKVATPAVAPNKPNTCFGGAFTATTGSLRTTGVSLDLSGGAKNSVSFWMYWTGGNSQMPFGFAIHDLWLQGGSFGFNSSNSDIFGIASAGLANGWHHVAAVFTNGNIPANKLWIDGVPQTLTQRASTPNNGNAHAANTFQFSGWTNSTGYRFGGTLDELKVYRGELTDSLVLSDYGASCVAPPLAEYRMDEGSWNGTTGEVLDYSGNGNNAQAFNGASTDSVTRAIVGNPGTCGYGVFDNGGTITRGYVQTPLPNLNTDFTITAWIRTTDNTRSGQRIVIDDQNNSSGYGLSLADGTAGRLRFYSRGIGPVSLDSTYTIANNTWYFVAAVADFTSRRRTIYVYNQSGVLLNASTDAAAWTGTWGTDAGPVSIGGETNASGEAPASFHFRGNLDEVRVYQQVLIQSVLDEVAIQSHPCSTAAPHHIRMSHDGSGLTCTPEVLTVIACANAACTAPHFTAAPVSGNVIWAGAPGGSVPFNITAGGTTAVNLPVTTEQSVTLGTSAISPAALNLSDCVNTGGGAACSLSFADSGLLLNMANHVSDTLQNITISAVRKADNALSCVPAFAGVTRAVNLKCVFNNPVSGTLPVRVAGAALNSAGNPAATCDGTGQTLNLAFDGTGVAPVTMQYADVGRVTLNATYNGSGATGDAGLLMTGTSAFVAAPASFAFSNITPGSIKAGNQFSARITARNTSGVATPNFGKEIAAEGVTLSSNLVSPLGGINPAISNNIIIGTNFTNGVANLINLSWSEVGLITMTANLTSASYLGSGMTATGISANTGAFTPDHFNTVTSSGMLCPTGLIPCSVQISGTVYSGQPFSTRLTAYSLSEAITHNYDSAFAYSKQVTLSAWSVKDALGNDTINPAGGILTMNTVPATAFNLGIANTNTPIYTFPASPTAPTDIFVRALDTDSVSSRRAIATNSVEGGIKVVSGRSKISNAYGSELLPLQMTATVQYWNGTNWGNSTTDGFTQFNSNLNSAGGNVVPVIVNGPLALGNISVASPSLGTVSAGVRVFTLNRSSVNGSVDLGLNAPAYLFTGSNTAGVNPAIAGRATFGVYKGNTDLIYQREAY